MTAMTNKAGAMAFATYLKCYEMGVHVRYTGDIIAVSPPLTIEASEIDRIFSTIAEAIKSITAMGEAGLDFTRYLKIEQDWVIHQQLN